MDQLIYFQTNLLLCFGLSCCIASISFFVRMIVYKVIFTLNSTLRFLGSAVLNYGSALIIWSGILEFCKSHKVLLEHKNFIAFSSFIVVYIIAETYFYYMTENYIFKDPIKVKDNTKTDIEENKNK